MLCMLNKIFSDSFHLHLKSLLEDLGVSLLSDSTVTLNQDYELYQFSRSLSRSSFSCARLCLVHASAHAEAYDLSTPAVD